MRLNKKIILGTAALAGIFSMPLVFKNTETYSTGCEIYQGNRRGADGERIYVFDEKTLEERGNEPINYTLLGNPDWRNELEIGRAYKLLINEGLTKRLVSFQPCTSSEQEIQNPK
ncbi:MAG: hypothetical protein AABX79_01840 [Nanoarchaeota archaeon]